MSSVFEADLETELKLELEKLDRIFLEESGNWSQDASNISFRDTSHRYELAEAESEKEELQDKLRLLTFKNEEYDRQLLELHQSNLELKSVNGKLNRENESLLQRIKVLEEAEIRLSKASSNDAAEKNFEQQLIQMEFKLAETRAKLARSEQHLEDQLLAKDLILKEYEKEKNARVHVEKERDAYSAAYQSSLQQFEKWLKFKQNQQS